MQDLRLAIVTTKLPPRLFVEVNLSMNSLKSEKWTKKTGSRSIRMSPIPQLQPKVTQTCSILCLNFIKHQNSVLLILMLQSNLLRASLKKWTRLKTRLKLMKRILLWKHLRLLRSNVKITSVIAATKSESGVKGFERVQQSVQHKPFMIV